MDFRNVDDVMSCQVCFEPYQSTGEHVPHIFPCNHMLCEKCIGQLIQRSYIVCPECHTRHFAGDSKLTFPQNKYILVNIQLNVIQKDEFAKNTEKKRNSIVQIPNVTKPSVCLVF